MKLGLIGCGKMGTALLKGALEAGAIAANDVYVSSRSQCSVDALVSELGVNGCGSNNMVAAKSDVVIVGTKPADICAVIGEAFANQDCMIISVAAGVSLTDLESAAPAGSKVVRTMPNTPALIGEGVTAFTLGTACGSSDAEIVTALFGGSCTLTEIPEKLMDAITGLSGSGPAYVYTFIEALADGAVAEGLPRATAIELAAKTVSGAAQMVLQTGTHPAELRDQVCSPGGTTIAAVSALEENGFRNATIKAVKASAAKSKKLS